MAQSKCGIFRTGIDFGSDAEGWAEPHQPNHNNLNFQIYRLHPYSGLPSQLPPTRKMSGSVFPAFRHCSEVQLFYSFVLRLVRPACSSLHRAYGSCVERRALTHNSKVRVRKPTSTCIMYKFSIRCIAHAPLDYRTSD